MLGTRILTAAFVLLLLVGFAWLLPPVGFDLLLLAIVAIACFEWVRLLRVTVRSSAVIAMGFFAVGALGLLVLPSVMTAANGVGAGVMPLYVFAAIVWLVAVPFALSRFEALGGNRLAGRVVAVALCFATWLALIQADAFGKPFLLSVLLIVWVADTAAYFAGRAFGKTKLAPRISPGKTREGVAGALVGVALIAFLAAYSDIVSGARNGGSVFSLIQISLGGGFLLVFSVLIALVSVVGDLYESLIKRMAGVKDSGSLLPGHGGVLDRIDALIAVLPVTMCLVTLIQSGWIGR